MRPSRLVRAAAAVSLLAAAGCAEPTYPSVGRVVYRDGRPFTAGGTIQFESAAPPHARSMSALGPNGEFTLSSHREGSGAVAGEQRVCVIPALTEPLLQGIARQRVIDPKYCAFHTSGLTVTVAPGANTFEIQVDPPPGAGQKPK